MPLQKELRVVLGLFALAISAAGICKAADQASRRPNVLFVAVDDLTCSLGCYGDPVAKTPNFDRLAKRGVLFEHAYCQLPLCNPSRASVLTGRRPDEIEVYDLDRHFREAQPDLKSLPQLFKENGWFAARVGKLYHYNVPAGIGTNGLDDPVSWKVRVNPKGRDTREEHLITNAEPHRKISAALSWLAAEGQDTEQTDGKVATEAIRLMETHREDPFFLGVGFYRPHTPYVAPKKYFDLYSLETLALPYAPADDRDDIPAAAFAHNCPIPNYGLPEQTCIRAMQGYYASVSFVDAQLGRLLDALDRLELANRTIVVVWSDHGYHLGEHGGIWQKRCLFEESSRAPMIMYVPGAEGNGQRCERIVEFVDIYPTLAALGALQADASLTGKDLSPLLKDPHRQWNGAAVTQVLRPGEGVPVMGRSVRTERWRYSEWNGGEEGRELYDHQEDPHEFHNLAGQPGRERIVEELKAILDQRARPLPPETPFNPARL